MPQKPVNEQVEQVKDQVEGQVQSAVEGAQHEVARSRVPWYHASKRTRILIAVYLLQFFVFLALAVFVYSHPILPLDVAITQEFQENQSPWLSNLMLAVSYLGNVPLLLPAIVLVTGLLFWMVRLRLEAVMILALSTVSVITNTLIKLIVSRPRPNAKLVEIFQAVSGQSFPSGHVMSYVAFFGLLFSFGLILFKRDRWWHYGLLIIPALFVILVGPSRVYLGAHWASDVLGGYLFGGLLLGITLWIYLVLRNKGVLAVSHKQQHIEQAVHETDEARKDTVKGQTASTRQDML